MKNSSNSVNFSVNTHPEIMFVTKYSINDEDIIVTLMGQEQTFSKNVTFFSLCQVHFFAWKALVKYALLCGKRQCDKTNFWTNYFTKCVKIPFDPNMFLNAPRLKSFTKYLKVLRIKVFRPGMGKAVK